MIQKVKLRVGAPVLQLARSFGIDIRKVRFLDREIRRLRSIRQPEARLHATEELVRKNPDHPKPHLELAQCLHILSDAREFEQMDCYAEILREWLVRTGLEELGMEFVWPGMVVGSLGNHCAVEGLLRANQYGLRPTKKLFLLLPNNAQLRNPSLFSYFEPYIQVVRDGEAIRALEQLEPLLTLPLGLGLPLNNGCAFMDIAANMAEIEREKKGLKSALFCLSDQHWEIGQQALKKMGLPEDAWYVTLHVREPGYRGETQENTTANWRNANPLDYLKACKVITQAGGWVFRMGDPSMTPLPPIPQVIDYAHHEIRSDWLDVFLSASSQFMIGTASGVFRIPRYFGVPVIFSNCASSVPYYSLNGHDLYLPRLIVHKSSGEYLSFDNFMSPPLSMFWRMKSFKDAELHWVANTPEELEAATMEMLERTDPRSPQPPQDDEIQQRFKMLAEICGLKYGGRQVKAFASISQDFLQRHSDLI